MQIDFNQQLQTIYGTPLREKAPDPEDPEKVTEQELTLRHVAVSALLRSEQGMEGKVKLQRYALAQRIQSSNGTAEVSVKEAATIQKQVGKFYPPLVVGQALPMLEGNK